MIHPGLAASLTRIEAHFQADPRCTALYLWGSLGNGTADTHSDVDVALVVDDQEYQAVKSALRSLCETLCGPILAWLPEGEQPGSCNFAFLFACEDAVLLYDFYLSSAAEAHKGPGAAPKRVLFDRNGLFETSGSLPTTSVPLENGLLRDITTYWIYMYLNGKYYSRRDLYKMLYVQQVLFQTHRKVLLTRSGLASGNWWVKDIHRLPENHQAELNVYFPLPNVEALVMALGEEVDLFARDAREACLRHSLHYPSEMEEAVRRHLLRMKVSQAAYP